MNEQQEVEKEYKDNPCEFCGEKVLSHLENLCSLCEETIEEEFGEGIPQGAKAKILKGLFEKGGDAR